MPYKDPEKRRAYNKAYNNAHSAENSAKRLANIEEELERERASHAARREQDRASAAMWRKNNRERDLSYKKQHHANNKKRLNAESAAYHAKHRDDILTRKKAQRLINIEECRQMEIARSHKRRSHKRNAAGDCSVDDWRIVSEILGLKCLHPNKSECHGKIHQDHIRPLSQGGSNHPTNRQPLCEHHNTSKYTKWVDYRSKSQIKKILAAFQLKMDFAA